VPCVLIMLFARKWTCAEMRRRPPIARDLVSLRQHTFGEHNSGLLRLERDHWPIPGLPAYLAAGLCWPHSHGEPE